LHDTRVQPTRGNMPDPAGHPPRPRQLGPQTALQTAMSEADVHFCAIKKAHLLWARHRARTTYIVNRARLKCVLGTERLHGWRPPNDGRRVCVEMGQNVSSPYKPSLPDGSSSRCWCECRLVPGTRPGERSSAAAAFRACRGPACQYPPQGHGAAPGGFPGAGRSLQRPKPGGPLAPGTAGVCGRMADGHT
jgi:hypothetical protein